MSKKNEEEILLLSLIVIFICPAIFAQKIIGNWKGSVEAQGIELPIVFHFNKNSDGNLDGKWDSPKQNAMGLPYSSIEANDDSVHIAIEMIDGSYEGKFVGNDSMTGTWTQRGNQLPLNFSQN